MASFGSGFAQGMQSGAGLVAQVRDSQYREKQREREQQQWAREDAEREQIRALGADVTHGVVDPESDNSYDVAEGKRLGMDVKSTIKRKKMSDVDIENRYGQIALDSGKMDQYMASRQRAKAFEREEADKVFGAKLQKIAAGDIGTLGEFAKEYNKDTSTPGMLTMIQGKPHFVNPDTGNPEPVSFAQIAQMIGAGHAAGQGDWKQGVSMMLSGQQYRDQRGDAMADRGFKERTVANAEAGTANALALGTERNAIDRYQADNTRAYQQGSLGLQREKLAIDRTEAGAKAAAYNNMGKFGPMVQGVGPNGEAVPMVTVMGRDGQVSYKQVPMPEGVTFRQQVDPRVVESIAARLEGTPTGRTTADGKPEVYSPEMAFDAALQRAQQFRPGGAPNPAARDADSVVQFLRSQAAGGAQGAKAQGAMPGRKENTTQAQRLREMTLGGGR